MSESDDESLDLLEPKILRQKNGLKPLLCRPTPWVNDVRPAKFGWILMGFLASAEIRYGPDLPVYNEYGNRSLRNILVDYLAASTEDVGVCLRAMDDMFVCNTYHLLIQDQDFMSSESGSDSIIEDAFARINDLWKYTHVLANLEQCDQNVTVPTQMWLSPVLKKLRDTDPEADPNIDAVRAVLAYASEPGAVSALELDWGVFSWDPNNIGRHNTFVLFRRDDASYLYFGDGQYGLVSDLDELFSWRDGDQVSESSPSPRFLCYRKRPIDDVTDLYTVQCGEAQSESADSSSTSEELPAGGAPREPVAKTPALRPAPLEKRVPGGSSTLSWKRQQRTTRFNQDAECTED